MTNRQHATAGAERPGDLVVVGRSSEQERAAEGAASGAESADVPVDAHWSFFSVPPHPGPIPTGVGQTVAAQIEGDGEPLPVAAASLAPTADATRARIHTGAAAADLTRRAGAEAVTVGRDIAFAPGRFDHRSEAGRRRIAHELTHVAQQARHPGKPVVHRDGDQKVSASTTLAGLPEGHRRQLQVVSTLPIEAQVSGQLKRAFEASRISSPADEVVVDASVPENVTQGMKNLAGEWSSGKEPTLGPNQTVTVDLDLAPYQGKRGLYRFTWTKSPAAKKGGTPTSRILIEHVDRTPAAAAKDSADRTPAEPAKDPVEIKIKDAGLDVSGYSKKEKPALREAIAKVPASHLALVKGLKFRRESIHDQDPKIAGHYDEDKHTIVMFDNTFADTQVVFDEAGTATSYAAKQILHEIGHAVDLAPLRAAEKKTDVARDDLNAKAGTFSSKEEADAYARAAKALAKAEKEQRQARSESGTQTEATTNRDDEGVEVTSTKRVIGKGHQGVQFREAVKGDGKDISRYGEEDWQESYAEAYALYLTQPTLLRQIRPRTYEHLSEKLPK